MLRFHHFLPLLTSPALAEWNLGLTKSAEKAIDMQAAAIQPQARDGTNTYVPDGVFTAASHEVD